MINGLKMMYREEGLSALYWGVVVNTIAGSIANSVFFYVYNDGKKRYDFDPNKPYSFTTLFIALRSGLCSMLITTPFWTIKTR